MRNTHPTSRVTFGSGGIPCSFLFLAHRVESVFFSQLRDAMPPMSNARTAPPITAMAAQRAKPPMQRFLKSAYGYLPRIHYGCRTPVYPPSSYMQPRLMGNTKSALGE